MRQSIGTRLRRGRGMCQSDSGGAPLRGGRGMRQSIGTRLRRGRGMCQSNGGGASLRGG